MENQTANQNTSLNDEITPISTSFTQEDLKKSMNFVRNLQGIPVQEQALLTEEERVEKYLSLRDLKEFLLSSQDQEAMTTLKNRTLLGKISQQVMDGEQKPLEYSSDEDFIQIDTQPTSEAQVSHKIDIFDQQVDQNGQLLREIDQITSDMSDDAQVKLYIEQVKDLFKRERGKDAAKKNNLGNIISTQVETSVILQQHLLSQEELKMIDRETTMIYGNVKAVIPFVREKLMVEYVGQMNQLDQKPRYKRGAQIPIKEKRIFGVLTHYQVGYVPGVDICFTEDDETFVRDSYIFKSLISKNLHLQQNLNIENSLHNQKETACINIQQELFKLNAYNDYSKEAIKHESVDQFVKVGTIQQIEIFHQYLMNDLFKEEKAIDFQKAWFKGRDIDKKYYFVPLRRVDNPNTEIIEYEVDRKLMAKVERISKQGYRQLQIPIIQELQEKKISTLKERIDYLQKYILVKEDKPHRCYHFFQLLENLHELTAEEFASAIKGKPENLNCKTAYELLFKVSSRFQSINSFRECIFQAKPGDKEKIEEYPIMLLDPVKIISHLKFKYALDQCPKNVISAKNQYKKKYKEKNNLTTSQGKPIFSSFNIYRHYLSHQQWKRASQLPIVMQFFERSMFCHQLTAELGSEIHPEFVLWATSAAGNQSSKKSYETLETYGDTILKLGATLLSYYQLQDDKDSDESKIDQLKVVFITNLYLLRIGKRLKLSRFIRSVDQDLKVWNPPFSEQVSCTENLTCTGKNIADCVESLLGAHFMTNNLRKTLELISDMKIVPLKQAHLIDMFPDKDLTFILGDDLDEYQFDIENDRVEDIYHKYFKVQNIDPQIQNHLHSIVSKDRPMEYFGSAYFELINDPNINIKEMGCGDLEKKLLEYLLPVEKILQYEFKNKKILLEAFTHKSFKDAYGLTLCYEKLEVLGDSILDYIANSNIIKYTILGKYNLKERLAQKYITSEDFQPFDAHQAKSLLTKNDFLAKLVCLFGLHPYILFFKPKQMTPLEIREQLMKENDGQLEMWKYQKKLKETQNDKDADKYIQYSFKKDFLINGKENEIFEAPKILGDVFESLIGGIFIDGGIEKVIEVYQHLLAPFILFTAKFSKKLYKEPKEDFMILANLLKIKPDMKSKELNVNNLADYLTHDNFSNMYPKPHHIQIQEEIKEQSQNEDTFTTKLIQIDIIFNNNEVMQSGYGNTRKQAERNASIMGYKWLMENKVQEDQVQEITQQVNEGFLQDMEID